MRRVLLLTALLLATLAVPASAARTYRIDVPRTLAAPLAAAKAETDVPVLLPSRYLAERRRLYGAGGGEPGGWSFTLAAIRRCGGANACTVASFTAQRGGELTYPDRVELADGVTGRFRGLRCGASCSAPIVEWVQDGVLYTIQADAGTRRTERRRMIDLASSAIRNGPR